MREWIDIRRRSRAARRADRPRRGARRIGPAGQRGPGLWVSGAGSARRPGCGEDRPCWSTWPFRRTDAARCGRPACSRKWSCRRPRGRSLPGAAAHDEWFGQFHVRPEDLSPALRPIRNTNRRHRRPGGDDQKHSWWTRPCAMLHPVRVDEWFARERLACSQWAGGRRARGDHGWLAARATTSSSPGSVVLSPVNPAAALVGVGERPRERL